MNFDMNFDSPTSRPVMLNMLPILILKLVISYLDISHVVRLTEVNRPLRYLFTTDNDFWTYLLRSRLGIDLTDQKAAQAFDQVLLRLRSLRCSNCYLMELDRCPFFDGFWNRAFCDDCRWLEKFHLITAYTAKHNYFLTDDDLLTVRSISKDNPRSGRTGGHIRYFSCISVQRRSDEILRAMETTRQAQLTQQRRRSDQVGGLKRRADDEDDVENPKWIKA
jgi:hypothetical protein